MTETQYEKIKLTQYENMTGTQCDKIKLTQYENMTGTVERA